jgi:transcriptional/translational regulatory protein YebC/TACO1
MTSAKISDTARKKRFAKTRKAIQKATENPMPNLPSDEELEKLVDRARKKRGTQKKRKRAVG